MALVGIFLQMLSSQTLFRVTGTFVVINPFARQMWQQFSFDMCWIQRKPGYSVYCIIPVWIFEVVFHAVFPYVLTSDVTTAIVGELFKCTGLLNLAAFAATAGLNPVLLGVQHFFLVNDTINIIFLLILKDSSKCFNYLNNQKISQLFTRSVFAASFLHNDICADLPFLNFSRDWKVREV